jgi:alkyl sulfatase BDS1-like metallo-beta-lactamase superfamily hydrolase
MDEVLRLARQGQSVEKIADQLNLKPRVIQQWGERHPDFSKRFILNLEIGERSRRKRG